MTSGGAAIARAAEEEGAAVVPVRNGLARGQRRLWFVTGIESNFRTFLAAAIETGRAHGFDCRILDVGNIVAGWEHKRNDWRALGLEERVDRVDSLQALGRRTARGDFVLFLHMPGREIRDAWRTLDRAGCRVGVATLGVLSSVSGTGPEGWVATVRRSLTRFIKPTPCFWVVSGRECVRTYRHFFRSIASTRLIHAHSLDAERALQSAEVEPAKGRGRIVFLDQGWLSKLPPKAVPGVKYPPVTKEKYRDCVVRFLHLLRETYRLDVVVSAHPKSDGQHTMDLYAPHEVSFAGTASLVRGASLVVLNSTTAVHYAVLFRVPVLLFTSAELSDSTMDRTFRELGRELGRPFVDIDAPASTIREQLSSRSDEILSTGDLYAEYEEKFIRAHRGEAAPLWTTVFRALADMAGDAENSERSRAPR